MAFLDKWEEELNDFVKKNYQSFFAKNKIDFLKKEAGTTGVGTMFFSDSVMVVKVTYNNGKYAIEIGKLADNYWGLDLFKAYFKIVDYRIDDEDIANRKKALLDMFNSEDYAGNANYFNLNFNKIKNLFSSANYNETKIQLEKLSAEKQNYIKGN